MYMRKSNTNEFISKAINKHGDKYDYSKVNYINSNTKISIICKEHGEFTQTPGSHLFGRGCMECGKIKTALSSKKTTDIFISRSLEIHKNKYDYSKVEYNGCDNKVIIKCKEHGEFKQTTRNHLEGKGCPTCAKSYLFGNINSKQNKHTNQTFIHKANTVHENKFDYSKVEYTGYNNMVCIICKEHGEFLQKAHDHLNGRGCRRCYPNYSKSQIKWLDFISGYYNIHIQHALNNKEYLIPGTKMKADGYCKDTNTIYEFHGDLWHGNPRVFDHNKISYFGVNFGKLYENTLKKEETIKSLGYNLVVIWEYDWNKINKSIKLLQQKIRKNKN